MQNGYELAAVCECVSLAFQWLVFYLQPRSAVQEHGGGEHHLYGGDAYGVWLVYPDGGPILGARGDGDILPPGWL